MTASILRAAPSGRAAGLRPQPPAASSQSSILGAEGRGYIAGMLGHPSLPGTYVEVERQAYERAYDIGRRIRSEAVEELVEVLAGMLPTNVCLTNTNVPDHWAVPLETTMGELRKIAALVAKHHGEQG